MEDTSETKERKRDDTKDVYPCDQCEYAGSKTALYQHKQSKHEGIRYPCDQCKYAATNPYLIKNCTRNHNMKIDGIKKGYSCDQC